VKDGEVAVFVYKQKDGAVQDFIEGPFDDTIKTANFPMLSSLVGLAFGGGSLFQAEVYFINLAGVIQVKFGVPYFDVFDPRFLDFAVPVSVRGTISFKLGDYKAFIELHRLINFDLEAFNKQIKDAVVKYVKGVVTNIPQENGIPVMQLERKILQINEIVEGYIKPRMQNDFGVLVSAMDIAAIEADKESAGYASLKSVTQDIAAQTTQAQAAANIQNLQDTQRINAENMEATLAAQREKAQHAQRMQTDASNFAVHQLNQQTKVGIAGAEVLGQMGANGAMNMDEGGMNPAGMMAGIDGRCCWRADGRYDGQHDAGRTTVARRNTRRSGNAGPGDGAAPAAFGAV
jgi:membrane protease subunit (stomatin/prohibitin family)